MKFRIYVFYISPMNRYFKIKMIMIKKKIKEELKKKNNFLDVSSNRNFFGRSGDRSLL